MRRTPLEAWVKAKIGLPESRELTLQALADYQLEKLRATLEYVKGNSPFYRRHLSAYSPDTLHGLQDLAHWPLTTSDDLRRDALAFLCVSQSAVERVVTLPTRSAAEAPKRLFFSASDLELAVDFFHYGTAEIPKGQIKSFWLGTQNTQRSLAEDIERFWGSPVFEHYGAAEMCPGGGVQCAARDGFHLREADLYIEIVDPWTARPVADGGFGEVVVTTLTREAMPLIRYRSGHGAAIMTAPCPCGSKLRRMTALRKGTI